MIELTRIAPCEYTRLDSGIHHFVFHESSRAAVDSFFELLTQAYEGVPVDQTQLILFDIPQGDLPLAYLFWAFQRWLATRTTHVPARLAILIETHTLVPLVDAFLRGLRINVLKARFFRHAQSADATNWLLQDR